MDNKDDNNGTGDYDDDGVDVCKVFLALLNILSAPTM